MGVIIRNGIEYSGAGMGGVENATAVNYDNSLSGLEAQTVQEAVDELNESLGGINFITEDGKGITGYTLNGADTVYPFSSKKVVNLGKITTYDCSEFNGYENFTEDNFLVVVKNVYVTGGASSQQNVGSTSSNATATVTKTYDAPNITISGLSCSGRYAYGNLVSTCTGNISDYEVYLIY